MKKEIILKKEYKNLNIEVRYLKEQRTTITTSEALKAIKQ